MSEDAMTPDMHAVQNQVPAQLMTMIRSKKKTAPSLVDATDSGSGCSKKASVANLAPYLLPFFNNGSVLELPKTESRDFRHRTQLSGDWGGLRSELARHGFFFDLYSTSACQNPASTGLKTGSVNAKHPSFRIVFRPEPRRELQCRLAHPVKTLGLLAPHPAIFDLESTLNTPANLQARVHRRTPGANRSLHSLQQLPKSLRRPLAGLCSHWRPS
jgi:hypothetical protein